MKYNTIDMSNMKIGYLDILNKVADSEHKHRQSFLIYCRLCKEYKITTGRAIRRMARLKDQSLVNCGCRKNRIKTKEDHYRSALKLLYKQYKSSALQRNIYFNLSLEEFERIVKEKKCVYCGEDITRTVTSRTKFNSMDFVFAGIDRIDNNNGYILGNVATCCSVCNNMKGTSSIFDFLNKINKIYDNRLVEETL